MDVRAAGRKRRAIWIIAIAMIVLSPIVLMGLLRLGVAWLVEQEIAAIRQRGEPILFEDFMVGLPPITDEQRQAVRLFSQAMNAIPPLTDDEQKAFGELEVENTQPLPPEALTAAEAYLQRIEEGLVLLHQAISLGAPFSAHDATGFWMPARPYEQVIKASELLALEAMAAGETGDVGRALRSVQHNWMLAQHLHQPPYSLINHLVRVAVEGMAVQSLERVLHRAVLSDAQLAALSGLLRESPEDSMYRAEVFERAAGLALFPEPDSGRFGETAPRTLAFLYRLVGFYHCDQLAFLRHSEHIVANAKLPMPQRWQEAKDLEFDSAGIRYLYTRISEGLTWTRGRAIVLDANVRSSMRTARTALAVERYRLAEGRLPQSLDELATRFIDSIPPDPFTGKPLLYKPLEGAFSVYSVGQDETDDGGAKRNAAGHVYEPGADIPFTILRP
jgi:hypothetical protein